MFYSDSSSLFSFEQLKVWQQARLLTRSVYELTNRLPDYERFALGNQIRRAMISVTSNIAEGSGRISYKEKIHFLEIAYGSLSEVYSLLLVGSDLGFYQQEQVDVLKPQFAFVIKLLNGLKFKFTQELNK